MFLIMTICHVLDNRGSISSFECLTWLCAFRMVSENKKACLALHSTSTQRRVIRKLPLESSVRSSCVCRRKTFRKSNSVLESSDSVYPEHVVHVRLFIRKLIAAKWSQLYCVSRD
jgi:hypothetical protein